MAVPVIKGEPTVYDVLSMDPDTARRIEYRMKRMLEDKNILGASNADGKNLKVLLFSKLGSDEVMLEQE